MPILGFWRLVAKWQESKSFMRRSVAIAFTLLLHLLFFIWLTLPPRPLSQTVHTVIDDRSLVLTFIRPRQPKQARPPPATPHSTSQSTLVAHIEEALSRPTRDLHKLAAPSRQPAIPITQSPDESAVLSVGTSEPQTASYKAYGNSNFERAFTNSQRGLGVRLPGEDEPARVTGIHVETPPSLAERIRSIGHSLNCKDALFKGRMTDEELAKRGLTERQMQQKFLELGCH